MIQLKHKTHSMSNRKISKKQAIRIQKAKQSPTDKQGRVLGPEEEGLIIANYYHHADVEDAQGKTYRCQLRQHIGGLVAGDRVTWQKQDDKHGVIIARLPRRSVLARPDEKGDPKTIAANIDQIIIVIAPEPSPTLSLLDSYLVAAENLNISIVLLLNKIDIYDKNTLPQLDIYQQLAYPFIHASSKTQDGLHDLQTILAGKTSVFVGQSGVGKSSLLNALEPKQAAKVGTLVEKTKLGAHTTSTARLYHLQRGGALIDSPGIREFALWNMSAREIAHGFREFRDLVDNCKFRNCRHIDEPDCAIKKAINAGEINNARYKSYQYLIASLRT